MLNARHELVRRRLFGSASLIQRQTRRHLCRSRFLARTAAVVSLLIDLHSHERPALGSMYVMHAMVVIVLCTEQEDDWRSCAKKKFAVSLH